MVAYPKLNIDAADLAGQVEEAYSALSGITATAGGGQANGVLLARSFNRVTTVATAADSVKLPPAKAGAQITVFNKGANSLNVFPATGEVINALSANTAIAVAATKGMIFTCCVDGTWDTILGA